MTSSFSSNKLMGRAEIDAGYALAAAEPTDMVGHMACIQRYSAQCDSAVEFGVYDCTSTWALLAGHLKTLISYDIQLCADFVVDQPGAIAHKVDEVCRAAQGSDSEFKFVLGDSAQVDIEETDLLFIDSMHTYAHLTRELAKHPPKVRKFIILHDTTIFAHIDQTYEPTSKGLWPAIEEFLDRSPDWVLRERFTHCHGLTVLARIAP